MLKFPFHGICDQIVIIFPINTQNIYLIAEKKEKETYRHF